MAYNNKMYYYKDIIDSKKHLERVESTKSALARFKNYYQQHRYSLPEEWGLKSFQDFINLQKF